MAEEAAGHRVQSHPMINMQQSGELASQQEEQERMGCLLPQGIALPSMLAPDNSTVSVGQINCSLQLGFLGFEEVTLIFSVVQRCSRR